MENQNVCIDEASSKFPLNGFKYVFLKEIYGLQNVFESFANSNGMPFFILNGVNNFTIID